MPDNGNRYEIIDGELFVTRAPHWRHQEVCGNIYAIRVGGSEVENTYTGTIHSFAGMALVFPGYRIFSTYQGSYDPC